MRRYITLACFFATFLAFGQKPITTIPFILHGDHMFIEVSIDGSDPLDFIFDTGDGLSVLDLNVAQDLKLDLEHIEYHESVQGLISGALIKHNTLGISDLIMEKNIKVYATSLNHLEISIGRNVDGIVGWDLLRHHPVRINFDDMTFEIYDQGEFPKTGEAVDFTFENSIPVIEAKTTLNNGEKLKGTYFVNTGAGTSVDFNSPFSQANGIIDKTGEHYNYLIKGIGDKETRHYEGRVGSFSFGSFSFENMPIGISESNSGLQGHKKVSGIIGSRVLRQLNMVIDYSGKKLYFEKNGLYGKKIYVNCSGIDVQLTEDQDEVLIHQVYENSPASEAGIRQNDVLVSVNGTASMELGLIKIEELLKESGKTAEIVVRNSSGERKVSLNLKELL